MLRLINKIPSEAWPGIVLLACAVAAMLLANSEWAPMQTEVLKTVGTFSFGSLSISMTTAEWVKNLLMAVFFFYVGLELKRELMEGALSSVSTAMLPLVAALGGVLCPALIYLLVTNGTGFEHGWAIPAATDIAFALGVVALLGSRVPPALKIFLLAVAVVDDLIAILVIAFFYTDTLHLGWLAMVGVFYAPMLVLTRLKKNWHGMYMLLAMPMWACMQMSGVNPTIAGVLAALAIPMRNGDGESLLIELEHKLRPYVHYGVMPVFALASAGAAVGGGLAATLGHPVSLGIILGLFLGKPLGITIGTILGSLLMKAERPGTLPSIVGVGFVAGIGFTMSLFIGKLAFHNVEAELAVKIGVYAGSLLSAVIGLAVLAFVHRTPSEGTDESDIFTGGEDADKVH
ncbi:Na+/H+ antiporter NhaA [Sandaracinobacteroides hominis]|uniref:Na+/H+ antiporter NhaA n=1 Tax=Sandaracinobacteroides hominis TaxID=2780086 RepID=UPI0018F6C668|nr:Na+/H+ antiporter NhaA [Sandaracinobacteroides hominis]